jgi:hypothetical protein
VSCPRVLWRSCSEHASNGMAATCAGMESLYWHCCYRYGMTRTTIMAIMFCITGSMAAMLSLGDCKIVFGASPLAWGFTTWWAIDTGAKLTLYPWRNPTKLRKTLLLFKNLSNLVFLCCAFLQPAQCLRLSALYSDCVCKNNL